MIEHMNVIDTLSDQIAWVFAHLGDSNVLCIEIYP